MMVVFGEVFTGFRAWSDLADRGMVREVAA
jgi:hypothetical protein